MKGIVTLLVLVAISAGVFALGSFRRSSDGEPILKVAKEVALTVDVEKPAREQIIRLVQAPGDVEAVLEVEISSEIFAKIVEMPVEEGDIVREGDLLCRLDDKNLLADIESAKARIAQLYASVAQAEADVDKAQRDFEWQVKLSESNATSDLEIRDYTIMRKKSRAVLDMRNHEITQAQAMYKRIQEDLKKTVITSPIDGVISRLNAKQGEVVITGTMNNPGTVIMTISDLSKMQVRCRVDEVDIPLVSQGQIARIYLQSDPEKPVPARVFRVASKGIKQQGRDLVTFETMLEVLSDDKRIKPAMTANVEIEVAKRENAITVPVEAVVHRMRKDLPEAVVKEYDEKQSVTNLSNRALQAQYIKVLYVRNDDIAHVRLVNLGIADTHRVEVQEGIDPDDIVIIGPYRSLDHLKDGKKIVLSEKSKKEFDKPDDGIDHTENQNEEKVTKDESSKEDQTEEKQEKVATTTKP